LRLAGRGDHAASRNKAAASGAHEPDGGLCRLARAPHPKDRVQEPRGPRHAPGSTRSPKKRGRPSSGPQLSNSAQTVSRTGRSRLARTASQRRRCCRDHRDGRALTRVETPAGRAERRSPSAMPSRRAPVAPEPWLGPKLPRRAADRRATPRKGRAGFLPFRSQPTTRTGPTPRAVFATRGANERRSSTSPSDRRHTLGPTKGARPNASPIPPPEVAVTTLTIEARDLDTDARRLTTIEAVPPRDPARQRAALADAVARVFPEARLRSFSDGAATFLDSQHLIVASYADQSPTSNRRRGSEAAEPQDSLFAV
jgi:hypothetical protein